MNNFPVTDTADKTKKGNTQGFFPPQIFQMSIFHRLDQTLIEKLSFFFFLNAIPINTACVTSLLAVPLNVED